MRGNEGGGSGGVHATHGDDRGREEMKGRRAVFLPLDSQPPPQPCWCMCKYVLYRLQPGKEFDAR